MNEAIYDRALTLEEYNNLRASVGWGSRTQAQLDGILKDGTYLNVARINNVPVAMVRAFGDGGSIFVLADVIVAPQFQGKGIGGTLLQKAMDYLKAQVRQGEKTSVFVMASKGKEGFYEKFGFVAQPNEDNGAALAFKIEG